MAKQPLWPEAWNGQPAGEDDVPWQLAQATQATAAANAPALPAGVDWDFINEREGVLTIGYVPKDSGRRPDANSGVTIAAGFDLGRRSVAELQRLGLDDDLVTSLTPYLGRTNLAARTPNFWNQVTTGRWQDAYDNLQNFADAHTSRRQLEGGLMLDAINAGNLPAPRPGR